jgi:hypothetical protein
LVPWDLIFTVGCESSVLSPTPVVTYPYCLTCRKGGCNVVHTDDIPATLGANEH